MINEDDNDSVPSTSNGTSSSNNFTVVNLGGGQRGRKEVKGSEFVWAAALRNM